MRNLRKKTSEKKEASERTGTYLSWPVNFLLASDCLSACPGPAAGLILSGCWYDVFLLLSTAEDAERGFEATLEAAAEPWPLASRESVAEGGNMEGPGEY